MECSGKRVFVRADLNVPAKGGKVTDATRIERFVPTVKDLVAKGAIAVVASHFGRPDGKIVPEMSLKIVQPELEKYLGKPVTFVDDCIGDKVKNAVAVAKPGDVLLLENLRFYPEEEKNDAGFASRLAEYSDFYVNDAFSAAHRAHASTEGLARLRPAFAGRLMQAELESLDKALENPQRPVMAIVGGAKVSTKLELLGNLISKVDKLVIGGGMANTFLYAMGINIGKSLCEKDMADKARQIMAAASDKCKIILPGSVVVASQLAENQPVLTVPTTAIPDDKMVLDISELDARIIQDEMADCKTLLWNGPVGAFEVKPFDAATVEIAKFAARLTDQKRLISVAGGGDTVSALNMAGVEGAFTYVSTAGGAFLEWLEGKALPGVKALETN